MILPEAALLDRYLPGGAGSLLNALDEAVLLTDLAGKHLYANTFYYTSLGYDIGQDPNPDGSSNIHPDDAPVLKAKIKKLIAQGAQESEYRIRSKNGEWRYQTSRMRVMPDSTGKPAAILHVNRDVTEQKKRENAERQQAEQHRPAHALTTGEQAWEEKARTEAIVAALGDAISIQDRNYKILYQNQISKDIYGDHVGEYCYRAYQTRDRVCPRCHLTMTFADGKVHRMEQSRMTDAGRRYYDITASPVYGASGKIIAGIELVRDITERKQAEAEVAERGAMLQQIMDTAHVGIGVLDRAGRFIHANRYMADLFGCPLEEFIGSAYPDHVNAAERDTATRNIFVLLNSGSGAVELDRRYIRKDGSGFWGHLTCNRFYDSQGNIAGVIGAISDITDRKNAADALRQSEEKLNLVLDNVGAYIFMKDKQYRYTYVNKKTADLFGQRPEDIVGKTDASFFDPGSVEEIMQSDQLVLEEGKTAEREEVDLSVPDGRAHTYWTVKLPLRDSAGTVIGLCGISTDITERKRDEENHKRLLAAVSASGDGISITDDKDRFIYVNEAHARIYGSSPEKLLGKTWRDLTPPHLVPAIEQEFAVTLHNRSIGTWSGEAPTPRPDGTIVPTEVAATARWDEAGNYLGHICIVRDITERRKAEAALRESEQRFRGAFENAAVGASLVDFNGRFLKVNRYLCDMLGYPEAELLSKTFSDVTHPDDIRMGIEYMNRMMSGELESASFEKRYVRKDGEIIHIILSPAIVRDAAGTPQYFIGLFQNITGRKHAEAALWNSRNMLNQVLNTLPQSVFWKDRNSVYLGCNDVFARAAGLERPDQITGKTDFDLPWPRAEAEAYRADDHQVIADNLPKLHIVEPLQQADGSRHWIDTCKVPLADRDGNVIGVLGVYADITERVKTEKALAHSHDLMRYIIEHNRSAIAVHDRDLRYIYVSQRYLNDYNVKERDIIGKHHYEVFPDLPQKWRDVHQRALGGEVLSAEDDPYVRADGSMEWTRWECRPWYEEDGSIGGIIVYTEVITERRRVEEKIRRSEQQLRESQRIAHVGSWEHNPKTGEVFWSDELFRLLGLDPAKDKADFGNFFARVHPDDQPALRAAIEKTLSTKQAFDVEYRYVLPDGSIRFMHARADLLPDAEGNRVVLSGTGQDITARKKAETALRESEQRLRTLIDAIPDAVFFKDAAGTHIIANKANEVMYGLSPEMMLGKTVEDLLPPDFAAVCRRNDEEVMLRKATVRSEEESADPSGRKHILDTIKVPLYDDGKAIGLVGIARDITEEKVAQDKIKQSEEFVRNILDTVDEGFIVIGRDYRIMTANKAYCSQIGLPCDEVIGRTCYVVSHGINRPCHEAGEECVVKKVLESGKPETVIHKHADAGGHVLYVENKGFPVRDQAGDIVSVIETINNITERHLLEEERLKTQKLESIGMLAGGIAHDFNNLLQGLFGYISLAKMAGHDREKCRTALEQAEKALHQSVNLTSQLLTFSKGGKPVRKPIALEPVIENAVAFAMSGSPVGYRIVIPPDLWQIDGDAGQLGQVIQNIVLNAVQSMPASGDVLISARNIPGQDQHAGLSPGDHVEIRIEDQGVGIPEQYIDKIFDPYFTTKEKGSGLGLATSYSIMKSHHGQIRVSSQVGKGSIFFLYLPAIPDSAECPPVESAGAVTVNPTKLHILVMDDEELIRLLVKEMLVMLGHDVEVVARGEDAVDRYRQAVEEGSRFDAVILDYTIRGGMGGAETITLLKEIDPGVKAIVSSGYSDDNALINYRGIGFTGFLKKPYDIEELRKALDGLRS